MDIVIKQLKDRIEALKGLSRAFAVIIGAYKGCKKKDGEIKAGDPTKKEMELLGLGVKGLDIMTALLVPSDSQKVSEPVTLAVERLYRAAKGVTTPASSWKDVDNALGKLFGLAKEKQNSLCKGEWENRGMPLPDVTSAQFSKMVVSLLELEIDVRKRVDDYNTELAKKKPQELSVMVPSNMTRNALEEMGESVAELQFALTQYEPPTLSNAKGFQKLAALAGKLSGHPATAQKVPVKTQLQIAKEAFAKADEDRLAANRALVQARKDAKEKTAACEAAKQALAAAQEQAALDQEAEELRARLAEIEARRDVATAS